MKTVVTQGFAPLGGGGRNALLARHSAFTLAEVLITLGIIGIVAAMTIPTLMRNYQERSWNTSAKIFEKKINEAIRIMNTQQNLSGYTSTEDFIANFSKNMKINKICNNKNLENCFIKKFTQNIINFNTMKVDTSITTRTDDLLNSNNFHLDGWGTNTAGVMFNNGTTALVVYNKNCKEDPYNNRFVGTNCIAMLYDTNGFSSPNIVGKDIHQYGNIKIGDAAFKLNGRLFKKAFEPYGLTPDECLNMVETNGYNIWCTGCSGGGVDYWAGAVKECGGQDKLPTIDDLKILAQIIYPNVTINTSGWGKIVSSCSGESDCRDKDALELVLNTLDIKTTEFSLFSNLQDNAPRAVFRGYDSNNTYQMNNSDTTTKCWPDIRTMCAY